MTNEQHTKQWISESSESKLTIVTDSHYLLSTHALNIKQSFNINFNPLPLEQLDISLLWPEIKNTYKKG